MKPLEDSRFGAIAVHSHFVDEGADAANLFGVRQPECVAQVGVRPPSEGGFAVLQGGVQVGQDSAEWGKVSGHGQLSRDDRPLYPGGALFSRRDLPQLAQDHGVPRPARCRGPSLGPLPLVRRANSDSRVPSTLTATR